MTWVQHPGVERDPPGKGDFRPPIRDLHFTYTATKQPSNPATHVKMFWPQAIANMWPDFLAKTVFAPVGGSLTGGASLGVSVPVTWPAFNFVDFVSSYAGSNFAARPVPGRASYQLSSFYAVLPFGRQQEQKTAERFHIAGDHTTIVIPSSRAMECFEARHL